MSNASNSEYYPLEIELDDGSNDSVGHQNTKPSTAQKKHDSQVKKGDSEFRRLCKDYLFPKYKFFR